MELVLVTAHDICKIRNKSKSQKLEFDCLSCALVQTQKRLEIFFE